MSCLSIARAGAVAPVSNYCRGLSSFLALSAFVLLTAAQALWAADNTGTITGRVMNATNGMYLSKAVVTIDGTTEEVLTDNSGFFKFEAVPAGEVKLKAAYVGEKAVTATVSLSAGATANIEMVFNNDGAKRNADGTIVLDAFTVAANRYKTAQEIATNEERNAVNIKNVVASDAFGDIPGGNVGEFVKFLPGVQVDYGSYGGANYGYSDSVASGVSVRGFGPEDTAILIDGMPVSNATPGSLTRQVGLDMLSINNASRVELIKVATPDMPANSVGGQINLVTKSAFELSRPSYSGRAFFNYNSLAPLSFHKEQGPSANRHYQLTPGGELSVSYPISKTFGVTVTGYGARQGDQTYRAETTPTYPTTASTTITNASGGLYLSNPAISRFKVTDIARLTDSTSSNIKLDWRPTPNQTISANFQYSNYRSMEAQRRLDFRPVVAAGADWGSTYTIGTTANSTTDMTVTTIDKNGNTKSAQLQYNFERSGWKVRAAASTSISSGENVDRANGHFSEIALKLNPGQVKFLNIVDGIPTTIETYQRSTVGTGLRDYTQLSNYSLDGTTAKSAEAHSRDTQNVYLVDVERSLDFIPWLRSNALTFKAGFRRDESKTEKWGLGTGYRKVIDTTKSSLYSVANILDTNYYTKSPGYNYPVQQWGSTTKLYQLDQQYNLFVEPNANTTDARENWYSYVGQQKNLTETRDGIYAMLSGQFFNNRLSFVGGVRQEETSRKGKGPYYDSKWYYAKNTDGSLYKDSGTGTYVDFRNSTFLSSSDLLARMKAAGVWYPDHYLSASGTTPLTLEGAQLARRALYPIRASQKGDPNPSLSASFALTKKIDIKAAWSRSVSLPKLEDTTYGLLSGNGYFTVNDYETADTDGYIGAISVANPNLLPTTSTNWDFQTSYYTDTGGKFSITYWTKSVTNQPETSTINYTYDPELFTSVLEAIGLDATTYQNYKLTTSSNSDTVQKTHGYEYEARQDFAFLGGWGRYFQAFASYSANSLGTPATPRPVTLTTTAGTTVTTTPTVSTITLRSNRFWGGGLQFANRRFSAQVRASYKNANETARSLLTTGNYLRTFEPASTRIDLNFSYVLDKHYSLFLSGKDVFNGERAKIIKDDAGLLPSYAQKSDLRKFGVTWTFGINGKF